jgi:hypothetical protein
MRGNREACSGSMIQALADRKARIKESLRAACQSQVGGPKGLTGRGVSGRGAAGGGGGGQPARRGWPRRSRRATGAAGRGTTRAAEAEGRAVTPAHRVGPCRGALGGAAPGAGSRRPGPGRSSRAPDGAGVPRRQRQPPCQQRAPRRSAVARQRLAGHPHGGQGAGRAPPPAAAAPAQGHPLLVAAPEHPKQPPRRSRLCPAGAEAVPLRRVGPGRRGRAARAALPSRAPQWHRRSGAAARWVRTPRKRVGTGRARRSCAAAAARVAQRSWPPPLAPLAHPLPSPLQGSPAWRCSTWPTTASLTWTWWFTWKTSPGCGTWS